MRTDVRGIVAISLLMVPFVLLIFVLEHAALEPNATVAIAGITLLTLMGLAALIAAHGSDR